MGGVMSLYLTQRLIIICVPITDMTEDSSEDFSGWEKAVDFQNKYFFLNFNKVKATTHSSY